LTLVLHTATLLWGGQENYQASALVLFIVHLPVAVIEGMVLGFAVGFLARVKPELLGICHEPALAGDDCSNDTPGP
jgi:cobalt/nickel transport system permease protein